MICVSCSVWSTCETMGTMQAHVAVLGHRGRDKERQVAVARVVARAAYAVHHAAAHDVRAVHVAVDVGLPIAAFMAITPRRRTSSGGC